MKITDEEAAGRLREYLAEGRTPAEWLARLQEIIRASVAKSKGIASLDLYVSVEIVRGNGSKVLQQTGRAIGPVGWQPRTPDGIILSPAGPLRNFLFQPNVSETQWDLAIGFLERPPA
ncbi:MAG TPA: hypothetical protein VN921_01575 [Chthoniobacterales bacterium]|nr:hypothetical protein [Chthoniobacterales bacterium]